MCVWGGATGLRSISSNSRLVENFPQSRWAVSPWWGTDRNKEKMLPYWCSIVLNSCLSVKYLWLSSWFIEDIYSFTPADGGHQLDSFPPFQPWLQPTLQPIPLRNRARGWRGEGSEAPLISEPFYNSQLCALKSQPDSSGILLPHLTMGRGEGPN